MVSLSQWDSDRILPTAVVPHAAAHTPRMAASSANTLTRGEAAPSCMLLPSASPSLLPVLLLPVLLLVAGGVRARVECRLW